MKNTKFTKIAILALSVALLIGAAIGFSVNAEDAEPQYEIIARNVVYGETVPVVYAVNVEVGSADAANVKVAYYYKKDGKDTWRNATALDTSDPVNVYNGYITFATDGVVPKKLGDVICATVYTGEAPADDAVWVEYSAAEYFYNRLYEDGFVNMEEADGKDYQKKLLYEAQLEYSTRAQLVLGYEEGETLVNAYNYAYTTNEYVQINGASSAFDVDTVTATYNGTGTVEAWVVDGVEVDSNTITVSGVTSIDVKLGVHTCVDENPADHKCDTCSETISECKNENTDHLCDICGTVVSSCNDTDSDNKCDVCGIYAFENDVVAGLVNGYTYSSNKSSDTSRIVYAQTTVTTNAGTLDADYGAFGVRFLRTADPTGAANNVLKVIINNGADKDTGKSEVTGIKLSKPEGATGKIHIIEYDFYLEYATEGGKAAFWFTAHDSSGTELVKIGGNNNGYMANVAFSESTSVDGQNVFHVGTTSSQSNENTYILLDAAKWYRLRTTWNESTGALYYEVSFDNGANWYNLVNATRTTKTTTSTIDYLMFNIQCYGFGANYYLDDISYKIVDTLPEISDTFGNDSVEFPNGR